MVTLLALALAATPALATAGQHLKGGQLDELVFDLGDAVRLEPAEVPEAARLLGQAAAQAEQKGDSVLAMQLGQMARRRDPKQLDALRVLTELSLRDQSFTEADGYAGTLAALAPNDPHLTLLRARVAAAEQDWDPASSLSAALVSNPALSTAETKEAQAIHAQAAPFVTAPRPAESSTSLEEDRLHAAAEAAAMDRAQAFSAKPQSGRGEVVLYGTSWCGFCKQARTYFKQHQVAFEDKDVERDPEAADEMRSKLEHAGLRSGGVPVIDVNGTIIKGFDRVAVERALHAGG